MKFAKVMIITLVFLFSIGLIVYATSVGCQRTIDTTNEKMSITGVVQCIIMFLNFLFLIIVYFNDRNRSEKMMLSEHNRSDFRFKQEQKSYWYRNFGVNENIKSFNLYVDSVDDFIRNASPETNDQIIREYLCELNVKYKTQIHNCLLDTFSVIAPDVREKLSEAIEMFEDDFANGIVKIRVCGDYNGGKDNLKDSLQNFKINFLKIIYEGENIKLQSI